MLFPYAKISGYGSYLPERILTNNELGETLDTTDEWIVSHTGIQSRHIAAENQSTSAMGLEAGLRALKNAGISAEELGMVIVTTCTGDYMNFPATACLIQDRIGAVHAAAFDLSAACSGFTYALELAKLQAISIQKPILLISAETLSRIVDWSDRSTCILFGDGAAAVVISPSETPGILSSILGADGSRAALLQLDGGCRMDRRKFEGVQYLKMNGKSTFSYAVRTFEDLIHQLLEKQHLCLEDISYIIPHQANLRIIEAVARRMNLTMDRFYMNIDHMANTSSASIPLALCELADSGKLKTGDYILSVAFGAGITYGGNVIRWD